MEALDKIKKLLALGKSPNANEAAAALAKAQELMEQYGVDKDTIVEAEIVEEEIIRHGGERPPAYEVYLMNAVARAFGCRLLHRRGFQEARWVYIGPQHRAEIASYVGVVLLRKLASARRTFVKTLYRCKRDTKVRRADEYCLGWVSVAIKKIKAFAGNEEDEAVLDRYMKRYDSAGELESIKRKAIARSNDDFYRGKISASGLEIQHGVGGEGHRQELLTSEPA